MLKKWLELQIVRRSGYFDPYYYLLKYEDVRRADHNPLKHFMNIGWRENRNPSDRFDTKYYFQMNPDIRNSGINPLLHYLIHGQKEGRTPVPPDIIPQAKKTSSDTTHFFASNKKKTFID